MSIRAFSPPASFIDILRRAILHEIIKFKVEKFEDTWVGQLEFMVALKKPADSCEDADKKPYPF